MRRQGESAFGRLQISVDLKIESQQDVKAEILYKPSKYSGVDKDEKAMSSAGTAVVREVVR